MTEWVYEIPWKTWTFIVAGLWGLYDLIITRPLRFLYFIGIWMDMDDADMCTQLAPGSDSETWRLNPAACDKLRERYFASFDAKVMCFVYFTIIFFLLCTLIFQCINHCCFVRPLANNIKQALRQTSAAPNDHPPTTTIINHRWYGVGSDGDGGVGIPYHRLPFKRTQSQLNLKTLTM